jgi:hypothetical protein
MLKEKVFEFVSVFVFLPKIDLEINAAIGLRYFFRQSLGTLFD